jgi:hypothetical protein
MSSKSVALAWRCDGDWSNSHAPAKLVMTAPAICTWVVPWVSVPEIPMMSVVGTVWPPTVPVTDADPPEAPPPPVDPPQATSAAAQAKQEKLSKTRRMAVTSYEPLPSVRRTSCRMYAACGNEEGRLLADRRMNA